MQPKNAPPAPPPAPLPNGEQNPYDFIMNTNQPKKSFGGGSMAQRLIIVVVGLAILIIVAVVAMSLISGGNTSNTTSLTDIAQRQAEIARIANIGVQKSTSSATKNLARTTKLSILSDQQQTLALLAENGQKVKPELLGIKQSASTDEALDAAATNNTFDTTFARILNEELLSYRAALQTTFRASVSNSEKILLQNSFNNASLLITEQKSS